MTYDEAMEIISETVAMDCSQSLGYYKRDAEGNLLNFTYDGIFVSKNLINISALKGNWRIYNDIR